MTRHSSKPNKLRNINPVRGRTGNVTIQKWKTTLNDNKNICIINKFNVSGNVYVKLVLKDKKKLQAVL